MATSLGWRDVGSVLLSKADAERRRGDGLRGDGGREEPIFTGAVMSRRKPRQSRVDEDFERDREQAMSTATDTAEILAKRPDSRLKWLQKAMLLVGKKQFKPALIYDIVKEREFVADVKPDIGYKMRALLLANSHLFSSKQQKFFESADCRLNEFTKPEASGGSKRSGGDKKRRKRSRSSSSARSSSSSRRHRSKRASRKKASERGRSRSPRREDSDAGEPAGRADPRVYARGAADD
mmetsp:Transcript_88307/g.227707  ORF Transcript_88307/g.227707 Transcript_88307/m.227707 type:complete len:237 (-) Transcript_88307:351-1061(-)